MNFSVECNKFAFDLSVWQAIQDHCPQKRKQNCQVFFLFQIFAQIE